MHKNGFCVRKKEGAVYGHWQYGEIFDCQKRQKITKAICKVNMEHQLDATISFIDLQDQLNMFRANFCPSSGAQDRDFYNIWYNVLLMW
jgi:hypothetical protein